MLEIFYKEACCRNSERVNLGEKPYQCEICLKSFSLKQPLDNHRRVHSGEIEKPYQCEICLKSFSKRHNLGRHKKVHSGEKPHQCNKCLKAFSEKSKEKDIKSALW